MLTLAAFLVTLAVLIVVHEYGHFIAARWCGVKVLRFAIGFGRPIFTRDFGKDRTQFVIAAFPLGGYVKMLDEREGPVPPADQARSYNRQNVWKRSAIVIAGPLANLLLAIALYWTLFMVGVTDMKPWIGQVAANSPAALASMHAGEIITKIGDTKISGWQEVRWNMLQQALKHGTVMVEASSGQNESHLHRIDLSHLSSKDFDDDVMEKIGLTPAKPEMPPRVGEILPDSAAQRDGLQVGDMIKTVDDMPVADWQSLTQIVRSNPGKPLLMQIVRQDHNVSLHVTPMATKENANVIGRIGAAYVMSDSENAQYLIDVKYPPLKALQHAVKKTWDTSLFSVKALASMVAGNMSWKGVSGPVTIATIAGQTAHIGWKAFLGFLALVSVSLGVLNMLPVPVLDGGHLMYHMVEILRGAPLSERTMEYGQRVGLTMLGLLMTVALYNDIVRFMAS
ncbi:MAG TPA: RIP metalloprotease RseP [Methylophilaceae bacterium]|jgi:regulator of sigma E protease